MNQRISAASLTPGCAERNYRSVAEQTNQQVNFLRQKPERRTLIIRHSRGKIMNGPIRSNTAPAGYRPASDNPVVEIKEQHGAIDNPL